jgi:hypothetical protein
MAFSDNVKQIVREHRSEVTILQLAISSAVANMAHMEFVRNFRQRVSPTRKIFVPGPEEVRKFVRRDGQFMCAISDQIIPHFIEMCKTVKMELSDFGFIYQDESIEATKGIIEAYIIANVDLHTPSLILNKFGLSAAKSNGPEDEKNNQLFFKDESIQLFDGKAIHPDIIRYTLDQAFYNLILRSEHLFDLSGKLVESNVGIEYQDGNDNFLSIWDETAPAKIYLTDRVLRNEKAMDIVGFVTSTTIVERNKNGVYTLNVAPLSQIENIVFSKKPQKVEAEVVKN